MKRIFIAVDIRQDIRKIIYRSVRKYFSYSDNIRLTAPENIHITFKFLGNTEDKEIISIRETIKESISEFKNFRYRLEDNIDAFPDRRRARIFFIGIGEGRKKFTDLHKSIEARLEELGIIKDMRDFYPHATIARIRSPISMKETASSIEPIFSDMLECSRVSLYESILKQDGVKYINIERFSLK